MIELNQPLDIGGVQLRNRVFLAPMSGVSDLPFRQLAWQAGAGLVVSEMVASAELCTRERGNLLRLKGDGLGTHVVQIAGREARWMAEAARITEGEGAHIIDINMGCPAKKVTGGLSGSALMRDLDHALALIEATIAAVRVPVTLKMRLGWDDETINAPELAARAQQAGVQMVTVHGRTRCQFYEGKADWHAIRAVKNAITIPLVANGDVLSRDDAVAILEASGADAVMVGRGAYGQPWLPGAIVHGMGRDASEMIADYAVAHYEAMLAHYGEPTGIRHARKHLGWYLETHGVDVGSAERGSIMTETNPRQVARRLHAALSRPSAEDMKKVA
ncbi:tRNA dihydrouridine synthase DusB [Phyllobacterium brassicacearum]|uniref:tRNA-dihydrouridine synthase n=1 Tax=Phyllobacterium brassicacearum TaxID=314235 RepID=A0A2P7BSF0_9HYPH|nr:tRNA dihydrouridine synthase DusB [Phyllobacterium brassicacearum]PSH69371.1 tRNA dihydrouridine synthase DusB [Phyllobacterium brassicacearum]TDQ34460.1 tRNA-U20-dihydrouridine synthase [Phyllobacterium brassicacearum]